MTIKITTLTTEQRAILAAANLPAGELVGSANTRVNALEAGRATGAGIKADALVGGAAAQMGRIGEVNALSLLKWKLERGLPASIYCHSDSTGDSMEEFNYLLLPALAARYPNYRVLYERWNDGTFDADEGQWNAQTIVQAGPAGAPTLTMFNAAVSGSAPYYLLGGKWAKIRAKMTGTPDVILDNHGLNTNSDAIIQRQSTHVGGWEFLRKALPGVAFYTELQNPLRDVDDMAITTQARLQGMAKYVEEATFGRTYYDYMEAGKPLTWFLDSVHPNAYGNAIKLRHLLRTFERAAASNALIVNPALTLRSATTAGLQLATNGDYSAWSGIAAPDGWVAAGSAVIDKVTQDGRQAARVTGPAGARLQQALNGTQVAALKANGFATLYAEVWSPYGSPPTTAARLALSFNTPGGTVSTSSRGAAKGGWFPLVLIDVPVPSDATTCTIFLYNDTGVGTTTTYYSGASLVPGTSPFGY